MEKLFLYSLIFIAAISVPSAAQNAPDATTETENTEIEEIVTYGQQNWDRHDGMKAFFNGDFKTAEIEFEREFLSLKRFESSRENAANDADIGRDRADSTAVMNAATGVVAGPGGGVQVQSAPTSAPRSGGVSGRFNKKQATGNSLLTDGVITYHDFAFTKYMAGLSEIKLGKYDEAKVSLKQSLNHDGKNFDARMRLGLIYVQDRNFEDAAKQLTKLDKMRKKCIKLSCDDMKGLNDSTLTLAKAITQTTQSQ